MRPPPTHTPARVTRGTAVWTFRNPLTIRPPEGRDKTWILALALCSPPGIGTGTGWNTRCTGDTAASCTGDTPASRSARTDRARASPGWSAPSGRSIGQDEPGHLLAQ